MHMGSPALNGKFYEKIAAELNGLLELLDRKAWKELDEKVKKYGEYAGPEEVENELFSTLIESNPASFWEWASSQGRCEGLKLSTLKRIYDGLVREGRVEAIRQVLGYLRAVRFNPEYKSIDVLMAEQERELSAGELERRIEERIEVVLDILEMQLRYN